MTGRIVLMSNTHSFLWFSFCLPFTGMIASAAVSVGSSSLIGQLDYSDSYTIGAGSPIAARQSYIAQTFPMPAGADTVENNYGNTSRSWGTTHWSIATDASHSPTAMSPYPGTSGAGSATGFTQTGGNAHWSLQYGLRDVFVIQSDFVQTLDRINITLGAAPNTVLGSNISIFFRTTGSGFGPEIGIYNGTTETSTGFSSGIAAANQWHNYAIHVDIPNDTIEVFVNESSVGVIDLNTIGGGIYNDLLDNTYVGVGGFGSDRTWSDNFQVGSIPEPSVNLLLLTGVGLMMRRRRK